MYGKAADASIEALGLQFLLEFFGVEDSPTTGSWEVGYYYKLIETYWTNGLNRWEPASALFELPRGLFRVKKGTPFLCHEPVLKIHKGLGECAVDFRPHIRLVCRDPRFKEEYQFLVWDQVIWEKDQGPHCFKKITSPLITLALVAEGLVPEAAPE